MLRLTLVCHDVPFPPTHGGRVDMWRRIRALSLLGHALQIIAWAYEEPSEASLREMERVAERVLILPLRRTVGFRLSRLPALLRSPLFVALRQLPSADFRRVLRAVEMFGPDCVWLDGLTGAALSRRLARRLGVPHVTRSHNIEHRYLCEIARCARAFREKAVNSLGCLGLRSFELRTLQESAAVFDISSDDLGYWRKQGLRNGKWLPPLAEIRELGTDRTTPLVPPDFDVGFVGNLYQPNNLAALRWLCAEVFPVIRAARPGASLLLAGSSPVQAVRDLCKADSAIHLIENPPDAFEVFGKARVLANPALAGSGVSIKLIDMLSSGRPVVTTAKGLGGLPPGVLDHVRVADDAPGFARAVLGALADDRSPVAQLEFVDRVFGLQTIERAAAEMESLVWAAKAGTRAQQPY